jgi:formate hydrogenlyase transcriptional activator
MIMAGRGGNLSLAGAIHGTPAAPAPGPVLEVDVSRILTAAELEEIERRNLLRALEHCGGKISGVSGAAALLGIPPSTFSSRLKALGIKRPAGESR